MGLIDLKTDLKSLKFGNDRIGGGNSGQPYITSPIPDGTNRLGVLDNDFLLRGGITAVTNSGEDVIRLGKYFTSLRSPSGLLFTAKQQLLSRSAVRTQTSGILNDGVYNPLSTLAQAGVNAFGGHLNKQGINPFAETGAYSNNKNLYSVKVKTDQPSDENRLVKLKEAIDEKSTKSVDGIRLNNGINVLSYDGGPNSVLGIGQTNIRYASPEQRTGDQNKYFGSEFFIGKNQSKQTLTNQYKKPFGLSVEYNRLWDSDIIKLDTLNQFNNPTFAYSIYNSGSTFPETNTELFTQNTTVLTQEQLQAASDVINETRGSAQFTPRISDFRAVLRQNLQSSTVISKAPSYNIADNKTIEGRTLMGDPGNKTGKNLISYTSGSGIGPVDKINAAAVGTDLSNDDLVQFRIQSLFTGGSTLAFRAFLGSISDSYSSTINSQQYVGRGENFYTYGGQSRKISLSWTVAALSREELLPMYKRLSYLAGMTAPKYVNGFMQGPLVNLTIGGYIYNLPGYIEGFSLEMAEDSTWEIAMNENGEKDNTISQLTHIIKVSGFNFQPIPDYLPETGARFISIVNPAGTQL